MPGWSSGPKAKRASAEGEGSELSVDRIFAVRRNRRIARAEGGLFAHIFKMRKTEAY